MMQAMFSAKDSRATVLVVDDNKDLVYIATRMLSEHGLTVLGAYNGPDCLEIVGKRPVDVVILDVMMPAMDGLQVCKELKRISPSLPVIFLTVKDDMATRTAGIAVGASEFVPKPFNKRDLLARVHTQILTRQWEREMNRTYSTIGQLPKTSSAEK